MELRATVSHLVELQQGTDHRISQLQAHVGSLVEVVKTLQANLQHYSDHANETRAAILSKIENLEAVEETIVEETTASGSPSQA